jgi:cobalt-zinc-cadmium efflux system membrane fusion protein
MSALVRRPVAAVLSCVAIACSRSTSAPPSRQTVLADTATLSAQSVMIAGFSTSPAIYEPWRDGWRIPGRLGLDPQTTQPLGSNVEGRVLEVRVLPGDRVVTGQVLVAIHTHEMMDARKQLTTARSAAISADSAAVAADAHAARTERLFGAKAAALAEVERARAVRAAADAARAEAHAELERATEFLDHLRGAGPVPAGTDEHAALIRAPFDGVVVGRMVQPGQVVLVGAPLVTVGRNGTVALSLHLPEAALIAATVGSPVQFTVPALGTRRFEATVSRVSPALDSLTRTLEVVATVRDRDALLRPELYVAAELFGPVGARTLTVPAGAVQSFEGDTVVITARQRGEGLHLAAQRVRVGRRNGDRAEILAGVDSTASVVVLGAAVAKAEILRRRATAEGTP